MLLAKAHGPVSNATTLQIGVIGCGRISQPHLRHLSELEGARVVATCDLVRDRADRAAAPWNAVVFEDYRRLLEDVELDAVYVLTPTPTHADIGCAVLQSGRHLLIEKPLATSREEADRLVAAAAASGKTTSVGHQWRYLLGVDRARDALGDEPLALVHGWYYWTWPLVSWIAEHKTGGGQMLDQGIHMIDLARYFAGDVDEVSAAYTLAARRNESFPNFDAQILHGRHQSGSLLAIIATYALFKEITEPPTLDLIARDLLVRITPKGTEISRPGQVNMFYEPEDAMVALDHSFVTACLTGDRSLIRSTIADASRSLAVVMNGNDSAASSSSRSAALP